MTGTTEKLYWGALPPSSSPATGGYTIPFSGGRRYPEQSYV